MLIDGAESLVTTAKIANNASIDIFYDTELARKGIQTEPGSLLIDQQTTAQRLENNRAAGFRPEEYIADIPGPLLAAPGNHFGWQQEAFLIQDGHPILLANDKDKITGSYSALLQKEGKWQVVTLHLENGEINEEDYKKLRGVTVGFNGPPIIASGELVPVSDIIDDPRIKADPRNLFDFAAGKEVPPTFFQDIRKQMPSSHHALDRMTRVQPSSVVARTLVPESETEREPFERLQGTIQRSNLTHLRMDIQGRDYRLGIFGKLPEQKMPLMGYGRNRNGELIMVAVDGRQEASAGVSISQLARLMKGKGAEDAILTCGGGDVAVLAKINDQVRVLNHPANKDADSSNVTRRVPNVVVIR
ncbi:phosphodiester glycosidase family protein [Reticulibacter mediterranei]|nr:phosphodiester glycosidase family protein [Reticulibacter mediterranei]